MKNHRNRGLDKKRIIKYLIVFVIIFFPFYFGITWLKPKTGESEVQKIDVETGDRPVERTEELKILVKADGGLNFRSDKNVDSEKIGTIPDGTSLVVKQELDGWYKVDFNSKEGWISKEFTTIEVAEVVDDATKDWPEFIGTIYGFKVKYPLGWSAQDYGQIVEGESLVAFSFSQLPTTVPQGTVFFTPIDVKISTKAQATLEDQYKNLPEKVISEVDIVGVKGVKYVYTDSSDSTEKTKVFFTLNANTYVISENGGYQTELNQFIKNFKLI